MNIEALLKAVTEASARERSRFMVTLGQLMDIAEQNPEGRVFLDGNQTLGKEDSYRGYYNELAFEPSDGEPISGAECYEACRRATIDVYEGYKGGDYTYNRDTPLWIDFYGCYSNRAVVGLAVVGGDIYLTSKIVD